jgi:hypothetical protein
MKTTSELVFACHSAACRPPTSGGTGGSIGGGRGRKSARKKGLSEKDRLEMQYGRGNVPSAAERAKIKVSTESWTPKGKKKKVAERSMGGDSGHWAHYD